VASVRWYNACSGGSEGLYSDCQYVDTTRLSEPRMVNRNAAAVWCECLLVILCFVRCCDQCTITTHAFAALLLQ
jgi:hypothetical protein